MQMDGADNFRVNLPDWEGRLHAANQAKTAMESTANAEKESSVEAVIFTDGGG
jgi:hypothetical protein